MEEKAEGIRIKEHQTALGVNFTVAGITGVCVFDEDTLLYYPVPKEYFSIFIEQYKPGLKVTKDLTTTVKANTTTGSKSAVADAGTVYYVESVTVGTVPSGVTGTFTVKVDDVIVAANVTLSSNASVNIVSTYGNRFRASKVEVIVTLSSAPSSDTDIPITATVVQKAVAF
jgi:hypothetical protein